MQYRTMPAHKDKLSILGYGCMRFPTTTEGNIDREKSTQMLQAAIDRGVNYFDTAWNYHQEESEVFLGEFLKDGLRDKVKIATKMPDWLIKEPAEMDVYFNKQLEKLQTDHIDYYLLHGLDNKPWQKIHNLGILDWLTKAKQSGKIGYAGFSFHDSFKVFHNIIDAYEWDFCQIQLNYLDIAYQAGLRGMRYAASKGIGIVVMEPLRGGFLADPLPDVVQAVWNKSREQRTAVDRALRFLWNYPQIQVVLSGMSTLVQVQENIQIADTVQAQSLTTHELNLYPQARKAIRSRKANPCTGCGYCQPCLSNVAISNVFSFYNQSKIFDSKDQTASMYMHSCPEDQRADKCTNCGACLPKCPQHIDIPTELKKVAGYFTTHEVTS